MQIRTALERGDPKALELIWDAFAVEMLACAQNALGSRQDAEDALHELFIRVARSRHAVAKAGNIRAYLYAMTRNIAFETLRRKGKESPMDDEAENRLPWQAPESDAASLQADLQAAMGALPEEQRTVVAMKVNDEMQFHEIAEALAISQGTAASRFRYAIAKMRKFLKT